MELKTWVKKTSDNAFKFKSNIRYELLKEAREIQNYGNNLLAQVPVGSLSGEALDGNTDVRFEVSDLNKNATHDYSLFIGLRGSQASYVEYGTGIIGESGPEHPELPSDYEYDVNEHGDTPWFYKHNTKSLGMPASAITYNAKMQLRNNLKKLKIERMLR